MNQMILDFDAIFVMCECVRCVLNAMQSTRIRLAVWCLHCNRKYNLRKSRNEWKFNKYVRSHEEWLTGVGVAVFEPKFLWLFNLIFEFFSLTVSLLWIVWKIAIGIGCASTATDDERFKGVLNQLKKLKFGLPNFEVQIFVFRRNYFVWEN